MSYVSLRIRCVRDPAKHAKVLRVEGMEKENVERLAGWLSGTSPDYSRAPGPQSPIGRCAVCGAALEFEVMEIHAELKKKGGANG